MKLFAGAPPANYKVFAGASPANNKQICLCSFELVNFLSLQHLVLATRWCGPKSAGILKTSAPKAI